MCLLHIFVAVLGVFYFHKILFSCLVLVMPPQCGDNFTAALTIIFFVEGPKWSCCLANGVTDAAAAGDADQLNF